MSFIDTLKKPFGVFAAKKLIEEHPIIKASLIRSQQIIHIIGENVKQDLVSELINDLFEIAESNDPKMKCREFLAESVKQRATFGVLLIPSEPEEDWSGLRGTQGVTGGLKSHLFEISKKDEGLKRVLYGGYKNPELKHALHAVHLFYNKYYWRSEIFDACRKELSDFNSVEGKDWYYPFIHAMFVCEESRYRQMLKLESAIPIPKDDPKFIPEVYSLLIESMYSSLYNFVLSGTTFPDLNWRELYKDSIFDGELQLPNYESLSKY
jgi:hypothetical protein